MLTGVGNSEKVTEKTLIPPPDWEALVAQIANEIIEEHSPARILQVRAKFYDLLSHCIPATTILKVNRLTGSKAHYCTPRLTKLIDTYVQADNED